MTKPFVTDTRVRGGLRRRRYQLPDGRRTNTVELPLTVFKAMGGMAKAAPLLERFARGEATRSRLVQIRARIKEGVKLTAIAHEFNVSQPTVSRLKKEMGL